jgi:type I restriction enzyme S subunit
MSKIDELIAKLCPDGVDFKELDKLLDYEQPGKYIVDSTNYSNEHSIPVLTAGQSFILGYTDEEHGVYEASPDKPVIIFDDFTTSFHWVDFNFKVKSSAMKMLRPKPGASIDFRYAYFAMRCINYSPTDHARHWISQYSKFTIPVPPIEVQHAIVGALNSFTKLEAELEAELEARKKQYEFYRNQLLSFDALTERERERERVEWATLSNIVRMARGVRVVKKELAISGEIPVYQNSMTPLGYFTKSNNQANTTFVITAGAAGEVGYSAVDFWAADDCFALICPDNLSSRFLYHFLKTKQEFLFSRVRRASVPRLSRTVIENIKVPVPPIEEQSRIVSILDKFDTLTTNISEGLPAELNARRKQYEHYRNKLLTFSELAHA